MAVKVKPYKGKWYVFIDHKNRRKAKCIGNKATAERVAEKVRAKLALGDFGITEGERTSRPFRTYYTGWLATYVAAHCKQSTYDGYEAAGRLYFFPAFGGRDITEITRDDVKAVAYRMLNVEKLARSTVKANLCPLNEMFNHALDDGHVTSNPVVRILKRSRRDAQFRRAPEEDFLTRVELAHLLATCRTSFVQWYAFVLFLARTGVRLGEALGVEWSDVDLHGRFVKIRRSIVERRIETPKSGKGRRVDMSQHLTDTLKSHSLRQRKAALEAGQPVPVRLFPGVDGDNFRSRVWSRLLEKAEVRRLRIKALRHTFASLLIEQGESLAYIRDQLGHSSIQVTVDVYGHLVPGGNRAAVDRLDDPLPTQPAATPAQPASSDRS